MFPAPVGGLVLPSDLAPSIVFAVLYALLLPVVVWRVSNRRSRTLLLIGRTIFCTERTVVFIIRAVQSQRPSLALSNGVLKYMQVSFGLSCVGIAGDMVNLLRCLLVNPTYGSDMWSLSPAFKTEDSSFEPPKAGDVDNPSLRLQVRQLTSFANLAFLAATIPGIIGNGHYNKNDFGNEATAKEVFNLRYASNGVTLFLTIGIVLAARWSQMSQRRTSHQAIKFVYGICFLSAIIGIYRMAVIWHETPSLDSTLPGTLNSPGAKAAFYILHVLPEWVASAAVFGFNVRRIFGTGPFGDGFIAARREKRAATGPGYVAMNDVQNGRA